VKSKLTVGFVDHFRRLPADAQIRAKKAYRLWANDHNHRSLHFKRVHPVDPVYSVRIDRNYRTLGLVDGDTIYWYWIGTHAEYDKQIEQRN
jgi:hypothetical protein